MAPPLDPIRGPKSASPCDARETKTICSPVNIRNTNLVCTPCYRQTLRERFITHGIFSTHRQQRRKVNAQAAAIRSTPYNNVRPFKTSMSSYLRTSQDTTSLAGARARSQLGVQGRIGCVMWGLALMSRMRRCGTRPAWQEYTVTTGKRVLQICVLFWTSYGLCNTYCRASASHLAILNTSATL